MEIYDTDENIVKCRKNKTRIEKTRLWEILNCLHSFKMYYSVLFTISITEIKILLVSSLFFIFYPKLIKKDVNKFICLCI